MRAALVAAAVALAAAGSCKERGPQTVDRHPQPASPQLEAAQRAPDRAPVAGRVDPATTRAIVATLKAMSVRRDCNRVMGCKPSVALLQHGAAALPVIAQLVANNPRLDKWWLIKVIDIVGQIDDEGAAPVLSSLLTDWRPELRARAALGLARLRFSSAHEALALAQKHFAEGSEQQRDPGTTGAIAFALHRTSKGATRSPAFKAAYLEAWPQTRLEIHSTLATIVGILAEIARDWRLDAALPMVRHALDHPSPFARIEAIRAAGAMRDVKAIGPLVGRLDDPQPSQRRAAIAALQQIVGTRELTSEADWRRWCNSRRCRATAPSL